MRRLISSAVLLAALAVAPNARAATATWIAPGNGSWNTGTNWSTGAVPTAADDVVVNTAVTININAAGTGASGVANSVTINAGATITRTAPRTLTVTNGITVNSAAAVAISVPFTAATLTKSGTGTLTFNAAALSGAGPEVTGNVDVTGGTLAMTGANAFTTGGLITVGTGATLSRAGGGAVAPTGGLTVNGGTATFAAGGGLNSGGPVTLTGGTMTFGGAGGLTSSGAVSLTGSAVTFNGTGGLNSSGAVSLTGSTLTFNAGGGLTATGQTVTVDATSSISTTTNASISAGTVNVTGGSITFGGNGSLTTSAAANVSSGGSLVFQGSGGVNAQSFSVASGSSFTVNFAAGNNPTNVVLTGGAAALNGTVNITGTPNATSFNLVTGAGSVDITGVTLGSAPSGFAFGFRTVSTTTIVLDVTVNPIAPEATASATGSCGTPLTWQHSIGATSNDRYLLVGVSTGAAAATPVSVTFGAQSMGLVASQVNGTSAAFIYGLVAPARGTATITVTLPPGACSAVGGSLSYTGVAQTTSTGTAVGAGGTGTTASATVSTAQGDKVISVLGSNGATSATPLSGATSRWSAIQGSVLGAGDTASRTGAGTLPVTMSWTLAPSSEFALAAIPIHAAAPTRAGDLLALVRASASGPVVSVRSGPGSDLVGFRVWREVSGRRELLTPGLVAGPVLSSRSMLLAGNEVAWQDRSPRGGATYLIESLHLDGSTRWTSTTPVGGPAPAVSASVIAEAPAVLDDRPSVTTTVAALQTVASVGADRVMQWQLADTDAVKLVVNRAGVVRVTADQLFAAGVPVGAPVASLQLFRAGRAVPRTVVAANGATLQSGDSVEFFGYGMDTRYSGSAVYWLVAGSGTGRELAVASSQAQAASPATYAASVEIRERLTWFGAARNGDAEKFFGPAVYGQAHQRTLSVDALDVSASNAHLEVGLIGVTDKAHSVALTVNGLAVGSVDFNGAVPATASIALPPGLLVPGDNVVGLVAPGAGDVSLEQYVRLVYPRLTARGAGALDFTLAGGSSARLDGFDPERTRVLDVTDPDAPFRVALQNASGAAAVLATGSGTRHLIAYLPEDAAAPAAIFRNRPSHWHDGAGADLVILGPSELFDAIRPLVERRQSEGLTVALVDIEDVQDEFASGEKSVDAVRAFLSRALSVWETKPRYLLLLGSASYDPRNYLGLAGDLVPSAAVQTSVLEAVSDSWFVGAPEAQALSVGRLPVRSITETQAVVAKILARQEASFRSPWLLVSDARGTSDFPEMAADVRATLPWAPATLVNRQLDPSQQGVLDAVAHQQVLDAVRAGPAFVNYTGHGAENFWSGNLHTVDDVKAFAGGPTALWAHMTCLAAFFQDPARQSLAVATLLEPTGGAWGAWGSTAITYPASHGALNRTLVRSLFVDGRTLGEATRDALAVAADPEVQATFVLLGDPSARAVATQALTASTPKASGALGCSTAGSSSAALAALLVLAGWLASTRRRRVR